MSEKFILLGACIVAGLLVVAISLSIPTTVAQTGNMGQQGQRPMSDKENDERPSVQFALNKKYMDYNNGVFKVRVGGGSHVAPLTMFFPNHAEIKVGETVTFYNPTKVSEPHTVTFIIDNSTFGDFAMPFIVDNKTAITSAQPGANAEPVVMPGPDGKTVIVGVNARSLAPTVIDASGNVTALPPNANYTFTGTEKHVNSGWMWPSGLAPPGFPPIDSFSVTFTKPGDYNYICVVHPWMAGDIVVK